jgi:hypothetical protein
MSDKFETWAIVELMGHNQIAGLLSEQAIGGQAFIRVDVPEMNGAPGFTKFLGDKAIYAFTPVSEEAARLAIGQLAIRPIKIWLPEINRQLPPPTIEPELEPCDCCDDPGAPADEVGCACMCHR